jgi:ribonuclease R
LTPREPRATVKFSKVNEMRASADDSLPLRERLLDLLREEDKPIAVREVVRRLGLSGPARQELKPLLRRLLEEGEVVNIRGARIGLPSRMNLVVGRLTCNPAGFGFVVPERKGEGARGSDVYVSAVNLKEALHGDRVVARIERMNEKGPEGRIIRILERALQRIVGRYEQEGRFGGHVVPFDRRILHQVFIPAGDEAGAKPGEMVSVEITRPPTATRNPIGRVLQVLGRLEDPGVDLKVVMAKHGLPDAFPPEVEAEAARTPRAVTAKDLEGRTDFRSSTTVTVDPVTARDHDDAIGLDRGPGGGWKLAVHIADVAQYVRPGSALDQEAYLRGTSVYFPDRVVPMLPHELSSHICSLVEAEDRLTQTVVIELDAEGRVGKTAFHDGVIKSAARMTYPDAQKIVDGDAALTERFAHVAPLLKDMDALARLMRQRRHERGALDLDLPETELVLDETGKVTAIVASERLDSMRAIEEFMLAANKAVAERLHAAGVPALFRVHETPDPEKVEELAELLASFGYRLPSRGDAVRPEDFQAVLRQIADKPEEKLISYLLLRTMKLARYHDENLGHFGLATEMYAHFTSPIRRYPDLVVHRALRALRQGGDREAQAAPREALPEMGRHLSEMERRADEAERELIDWKKVRFMAEKLGEVFTGYITGVKAFGLFVQLEGIFVEGMVHVSSMTDDYYQFNEKTHTLRGENTRRSYRLGDKAEVQVVRADLERRQVDFALVDVLQRAGAAGRHGRPRAAAAGGRGPRRTGRRR